MEKFIGLRAPRSRTNSTVLLLLIALICIKNTMPEWLFGVAIIVLIVGVPQILCRLFGETNRMDDFVINRPAGGKGDNFLGDLKLMLLIPLVILFVPALICFKFLRNYFFVRKVLPVDDVAGELDAEQEHKPAIVTKPMDFEKKYWKNY